VLNKSRGRPRGNPPTKARIADEAHRLFLERGYRATTVRAVAAAAGVDSALISYHFGSKQGLFAESVRHRCSRSAALSRAVDGDLAGLADRLLDAVIALWDEPEPADRPDDAVMAVFREYLEREVIARIAELLRGPDATARATAAITVLGGLVYTRYLNPLAPTAGLSRDDVRRVHRPALHAALHGRPVRHRSPVSRTAR
jgi:AcrR family transcriptional regulator